MAHGRGHLATRGARLRRARDRHGLLVATRSARLRRARDRHGLVGGDPQRPAAPRSRSPRLALGEGSPKRRAASPELRYPDG
ncbi:hypothetical protein C0J29_29830 [Mycobacterium paragordonae]|nr:hypothetical protein C0J29_29830 [Mycobacterium paragordonae]